MLRIEIGECWIPEPIYFNHLTNYTTFSACLKSILNNRMVVMVTYYVSSMILVLGTRLFVHFIIMFHLKTGFFYFMANIWVLVLVFLRNY